MIFRPPDPDTCHPAYAQYANVIRANLPKNQDIVIAAGEFTPEHKLAVFEHRGGFPFVGDPDEIIGYYFWRSAVDDLGRAVAGPARPVMRVMV